MELSGAKKIIISSATKELPEDLIRTEILARLPLKSLARFKSVCKSWLSVLSSDPQFIKELYRRNIYDYDCIEAKKSNHIVILSIYKEITSLPVDGYKLIGSANGLVCMRRSNSVSLWNPAIYRSKEFDISLPYYCHMHKIGFGYDLVSNDYKVVVCYRSLSSFHLNCVVYSSNSGTWIDHGQMDVDKNIVMNKFRTRRIPTTMVKDCPHWKCTTRDKNKISLVALKFDATSNEFKFLAEFSCDVTSEHDKKFTFVNMKDLLALVVCVLSTTIKLDVYSLDEEKRCGGVWSKMYGFRPFEIYWCYKHPRTISYQGFKYGDEIVLYERGRIFRCDLKTKTLKVIPCKIVSPFKGCFTYTPSLISLPRMTSNLFRKPN